FTKLLTEGISTGRNVFPFIGELAGLEVLFADDFPSCFSDPAFFFVLADWLADFTALEPPAVGAAPFTTPSNPTKPRFAVKCSFDNASSGLTAPLTKSTLPMLNQFV